MTKRAKYEAIKGYLKDEELIAFLDGEIAKLDARAEVGRAKRAEKSADAGKAIAEGAKAALADAGRAITLPELVAGIEGDYTAAKVTYYIKPLVADGTIIKEKAKVGDRKVMTYRLG